MKIGEENIAINNIWIKFIITSRRVSWTAWIICLVLPSAYLLRVGKKGGSSYHKFLQWPEQLALRLLLFLFLQGQWFNTLSFWKIYQGLCSVLEGSTRWFFSDIFIGVFEVFGGSWLRFPRKLALTFHSNFPGILGSCYLFSWYFYRAVLVEVLWDFHSSLDSLLKRVSNVLVVTASPLREMYLEVFSLPSSLVVPWGRISIEDVVPFIWQALLLYPYLLFYSLRRRELNRGDRKK